MTWTINQEAYDRVTHGQDDRLPEPIKEMFTFRYPARVRILEGGPQGMAGKYHGLGRRGPTSDVILDEPAHHISLAANLSASMANTALWHETTHAAQAEREIPEDGDYTVVNRRLTQGFRAEMKEIRRKYGGSPSQLTARYAEVSYEKEAHASDKLAKEIELITVLSPHVEDSLKDEKGRFTWRCDIFSTEWSKEDKRRVKKAFRGTHYVLAPTEWGAKSFAKKEWGESTDDVEVYKTFPLSKDDDRHE